MAGWMVALIVACVRTLGRWEGRLSLRARKRVLLLCGMFGALFFLNLLIGALLRPGKKSLPDLRPDTISVPPIPFRQRMPVQVTDSPFHQDKTTDNILKTK